MVINAPTNPASAVAANFLEADFGPGVTISVTLWPSLLERFSLSRDLQNSCNEFLHNASKAKVLAKDDRNCIHLDQIVGG